MRVIVIGAGAVGGTLGGRLAEHGRAVVLVARGAHLAALRRDGLRLRLPDRELTVAVPAVAGPDGVALTADDVLVLAVKSPDTADVVRQWAERSVRMPDGGVAPAGEVLPLVCAQNGVDNERTALRWFRRVYGMCVWLPASHLRPGEVIAVGTPVTGVLDVGRYPRGLDDTAERIAGALSAGGFEGRAAADVMRWKYGKLVANLGNAVEALAGPIEGAAALEVYRRARAEGTAVLDAAGIGYADEAEYPAVRGHEPGVRPGGSTWQSLLRRTGQVETDYLNGEIVLLGRSIGVATPVNALLQRLANQHARERRLPGRVPAEELLATVSAAERRDRYPVPDQPSLCPA